MKSLHLLSGSVLLALAFHAQAAGTAAAGTAALDVTVAIKKFAFAPHEITIAPGTTVVWSNQDETPHTIIANDRSFVSKAMDTDDRFEHTFATEGDFNYFCTLHPFMTGIVHVHPNAKGSAASGVAK